MDENKLNILKLGIIMILMLFTGYLLGTIKPSHKIHCSINTIGQLDIEYETYYYESIYYFNNTIKVNNVEYNANCIKVI